MLEVTSWPQSGSEGAVATEKGGCCARCPTYLHHPLPSPIHAPHCTTLRASPCFHLIHARLPSLHSPSTRTTHFPPLTCVHPRFISLSQPLSSPNPRFPHSTDFFCGPSDRRSLKRLRHAVRSSHSCLLPPRLRRSIPHRLASSPRNPGWPTPLNFMVPSYAN